MNIYEKLAQARLKLKEKGLKQSGHNGYSDYDYFELADFIPTVNQIEAELKMISLVSFGTEEATLTVVNTEKVDEKITFSSPMSTANLKGCHEVQNLGAVQTYIRRYLYQTAYEIVECDALNKTQGKPQKDDKKTELEQANKTLVKLKSGEEKLMKDLTDEQLTAVANMQAYPALAKRAQIVLDSRANEQV